nr:putative inactive purple acid phosphatase 29 [Quercus suber]
MEVGCSSNFVEAVLLCLILFPIGILADMPLRFRKDGTFKILQVADMHYANGKNTTCEDVFLSEEPYCSDLNTTAFLERTILAENPDLIVFTGDNIYGFDCPNPKKSLSDAFAPAIASNIPWAELLY